MNVLERIPFQNNQAVVFDIDDTLIHSRTHRRIPNIYRLYNYCRNKGYKIYIITARAGTPQNMRFTQQQLQSLNIKGYRKIFFRHPMERRIAEYKKNCRKSIPEQVVMSIGDQMGDIGQYGGFGLIVRPN